MYNSLEDSSISSSEDLVSERNSLNVSQDTVFSDVDEIIPIFNSTLRFYPSDRSQDSLNVDVCADDNSDLQSSDVNESISCSDDDKISSNDDDNIPSSDDDNISGNDDDNIPSSDDDNISSNDDVNDHAQENFVRHRLSVMDIPCIHCGALHFEEETRVVKGERKFHLCCHDGVVPPSLMKVTLPPELETLLKSSSHFGHFIRRYNGAFALTTQEVDYDRTMMNLRNTGVYSFKINGEFHHYYTQNLMPVGKRKPRFAQLYIHDAQYQLEERMQVFSGLNRNILETLQAMIHRVNKFVHLIPPMDVLKNVKEVNMNFEAVPEDKRYALPSEQEVAALLPLEEPKSHYRAIRFTKHVVQNGEPITKSAQITQFNKIYDPLHYILMFPCGESGWTLNLKCGRTTNAKHITQTQFYVYRLFDRLEPNSGRHIPWMRRLFHQYIVDQYAKVEESRLNWIKNNQKLFTLNCIRASLTLQIQKRFLKKHVEFICPLLTLEAHATTKHCS